MFAYPACRRRAMTSSVAATIMLVITGAAAVARAQPAPAQTADAGAPDAAPTPIIAFPGQYTPRPPATDDRSASNAKTCLRRASVEARHACMASLLIDWPRLSRYEAANAALAAPVPADKRVVFFGDSI